MATYDTLNMAAEMRFVFEREKIDVAIVERLVKVGINTLPRFAAIADDQAMMRKLLKREFGLDSEGGTLEVMGTVASILVIWSGAKKRTEKITEIEGEAQARDLPKVVPQSEYKAMRSAFEKLHWKVDSDKLPSKAYLEKKLELVEQDDLRAELLTEVIANHEDTGSGELQTILDKDNVYRATRIGRTVPLPTNPEQLRKRITIMGTAWMMVGTAHSTRGYLKGITPQIFVNYCDYLLGEDVMGLITELDGVAVTGDYWDLLLKYEQAIRKDMIDRMGGGLELPAALKAAMESGVLKERKFTTPLGRIEQKSKRPATQPPQGQPEGKSRKQKKQAAAVARTTHAPSFASSSKGSKGKGKSKGAGLPGCAKVTKEGKPICYSFNNKNEGCSKTDCLYQHVCGICMKPNSPMFTCSHGHSA